MLLIFDWDGTLCDSTGKIITCLQKAALDTSLPVLPAESILDIIGLGIMEALRALYPAVADDKLHELRRAYSRWFLELDQTPSPFFEGVAETLADLRSHGHTLAIATGKSRQGLDRVLEGMGLRDVFHASRCADETCSKPDPQMVLELLEQFGCHARDAVMVGDTEYDMDMARRAGIPRIAVSYGAHGIERLRRYQPSLCIDSFPQIMGFFSGLRIEP